MKGYVYNYIIPCIRGLHSEKITSADIQRWVNNLAQKARTSIESGKNVLKKVVQKTLEQSLTNLVDIFDFGITHFGLTKTQ